jgi:hypothetical protein
MEESRDKITHFEGAHCPLWMKQMLDKMVTIADDILCMKTPKLYFIRLFGKYLYESMKYPLEKSLPHFLQYAECSIINLMFNKICRKFVNIGVLTAPVKIDFHRDFTPRTDYLIDQIEENDILSIDCPTIFTTYHFIFAVVGRDNVNIYQSFGNVPLYRNRLSLEEFKQQLKNMKNIRTYPRDEALRMIEDFETNVYLIDYHARFNELLRDVNKNIGSDSDDDNDPITMEELIDENYQRNIVTREREFSINVYKFIRSNCPPSTGGKRKSIKKSNSKKSKRKTRRMRI